VALSCSVRPFHSRCKVRRFSIGPSAARNTSPSSRIRVSPACATRPTRTPTPSTCSRGSTNILLRNAWRACREYGRPSEHSTWRILTCTTARTEQERSVVCVLVQPAHIADNTWRVDTRRCRSRQGAVAEMPRPAEACAEDSAGIVVDAMSHPGEFPLVRCRRPLAR